VGGGAWGTDEAQEKGQTFFDLKKKRERTEKKARFNSPRQASAVRGQPRRNYSTCRNFKRNFWRDGKGGKIRPATRGGQLDGQDMSGREKHSLSKGQRCACIQWDEEREQSVLAVARAQLARGPQERIHRSGDRLGIEDPVKFGGKAGKHCKVTQVIVAEGSRWEQEEMSRVGKGKDTAGAELLAIRGGSLGGTIGGELRRPGLSCTQV